MANWQEIAELALAQKPLSREQCREVLNSSDLEVPAMLEAAYRVRQHFCGNTVHIHVLTNAKSGLCQEDCHYCSQSKVSTAEIEKYPLMATEKLLGEAKRAKRLKAKRYCMAMSGRGPSDREIDHLCEAISQIKEETGLSICCSIGLLSADQAARLKAAGLDRLNHNLNTSEKHHPEICTTHTYQDRLDTLTVSRDAGLELCSGGIFGQGETEEDIIDLCMAWADLKPHSIPVNFLTPIENTPFEKLPSDLTPYRCLKILSLVRFLNPDREIRMAGGREYHLRTLQPLGLFPCNSIFITGYLTTPGQRGDDAMQMIKDMGFDVEFDEGMDDEMINAFESDQHGLPVTHSAKIATGCAAALQTAGVEDGQS